MSRWWNGLSAYDRSILTRLGMYLVVTIGLLVAATLMVGCAADGTSAKIPDGCSNSVIQRSIGNPQLASAAAIVAVTEAVIAHPSAREPVIRACRVIVDCLADGRLTYADLLRVVAEQDSLVAHDIGRRIAIYGDLFLSITADDFLTFVVDQCDRDFLVGHFAKQIKYLGGYGID